MQVRFRVSGRDLAPSLRLLIEQHFRFAVYPHRSMVNSVEVVISDETTEGAGSVKQCQAMISFCNGRSLTIERRDARLESVVQRVAKRVFHSLRCRKSKQRSELASCAE
jgi:hypothetical protein